MEATLAFAWNLSSKLMRLGRVLEKSGRRPAGVSEPSLGVFEESEACVRTSKGGKATSGKESQRFRGLVGAALGFLKTLLPSPLSLG